jgi:UDP-glucose 4-epimerase
MRAAALRYFNAAGADPDGEIGELHEPEAHLIPLAIQAVTGDGPPLTLFGSDYPTPDGTCIRDYIHVTDLADAHVRALEWLGSTSGSHAFNLGTGQGASVRLVLDAVEKVAGRPVPHSIGPRRAGDPAELVSDPAKANREFGWKPAHSDLETIVATAWAWHNRQGTRHG